MKNKRAQFFLLAAVIISSVVISLGVAGNVAKVSNEPKNFYDFSYNVKRESGAVVDYEVYKDINGGTLDKFVNLLVKDTQDSHPDSGFVVIFTNSSDGMDVISQSSSSIDINGEDVSPGGASTESKICLSSGVCGKTKGKAKNYGRGRFHFNSTSLLSSKEITTSISGNNFTFPLSNRPQVIFIIEKNRGGNRFVSSNG